jgi:hypothetical protein
MQLEAIYKKTEQEKTILEKTKKSRKMETRKE